MIFQMLDSVVPYRCASSITPARPRHFITPRPSPRIQRSSLTLFTLHPPPPPHSGTNSSLTTVQTRA